MRVGLIDYGGGNLGSVIRALEELRVTPVLLKKSIELDVVDRLILPGVGHFLDCARLLNEGGWVQALREQVLVGKKPLLGICVGMQMLATTSMEGVSGPGNNGIPGLNFIPGRVESLRTLGCKMRVPHVGWNDVEINNFSDPLFFGIPSGTDFYFVHSYSFVPDDSAHVLAKAIHGVSVTAAIGHGHIWGTQFHPEKSSRAGSRVLRNFIEYSAC